MRNKIKIQKGFIQIPLLMTIIASIIGISIIATGVILQKKGKLAPFIANISQILKGTQDAKPEIKSAELQPAEKQTVPEETGQEKNSQTGQEPKQAEPKNEKLEDKIETLKAKYETTGTAKNQQEASKTADEKQNQDNQKQKDLDKQQAENNEKAANVKNIDKELSQMISEIRQRADAFYQKKNDTNNFIPTIKNTMNKYPDSSLIQQSGQQLINELNNLSFLSGKLSDMDNSRIKTISSFLGSGKIPSTNDFSVSTSQYDNYYAQYEQADVKIKSLMSTFVANEKTVLDETLSKKQEQLQRTEKAAQIISQLSTMTQAADKQLAGLNTLIENKKAEIENAKNRPAPMELINAELAKLTPELNSYINQWNSLINTKNKIATVKYKLSDYATYGTLLSAEDRAFLLSFGISF